MQPPRPRLIIIAEVPGALTELGGISLLERLLRIVQRLGFDEATILSHSVAPLEAHLALSSAPRAGVSLKFRHCTHAVITTGDIQNSINATNAAGGDRALVISAGHYYDGRLLRALAHKVVTCVLVDSNPPAAASKLWENVGSSAIAETALLSQEWFLSKSPDEPLSTALGSDAEADKIERLDAAQVPAYLPDQRRSIRPVFFPAPSPSNRSIAEHILHDTTQKGVLDIPALVHAPIETWIVSHLCRRSITPNQVTLVTALIGIGVTILFASGHLWPGTLLALAVGILDGCDGKLARLKVETTPSGEWEHVVDYLIELSWWSALAYHFRVTGEVPHAYLMWFSLFVADLLARIAKGRVKKRTGRTLDDISRFDQVVRYVAARRNIYIWILAVALILGVPARGYIALYWCGIISAAIHLFRALQIRHSLSKTTAPA